MLHRLDRAAAELNPLLLLVVIGLAIIYLACLVALGLSHVDIHHIRQGRCPSAPCVEAALGQRGHENMRAQLTTAIERRHRE